MTPHRWHADRSWGFGWLLRGSEAGGTRSGAGSWADGWVGARLTGCMGHADGGGTLLTRLVDRSCGPARMNGTNAERVKGGAQI